MKGLPTSHTVSEHGLSHLLHRDLSPWNYLSFMTNDLHMMMQNSIEKELHIICDLASMILSKGKVGILSRSVSTAILL